VTPARASADAASHESGENPFKQQRSIRSYIVALAGNTIEYGFLAILMAIVLIPLCQWLAKGLSGAFSAIASGL
jgi:hypothetical protein